MLLVGHMSQIVLMVPEMHLLSTWYRTLPTTLCMVQAANGTAAGASDTPQDCGKQRKQKRKAEAADGGPAVDKKDGKNKKRKGGSGGATGPAPMGREAGGQDALAALQAQKKA